MLKPALRRIARLCKPLIPPSRTSWDLPYLCSYSLSKNRTPQTDAFAFGKAGWQRNALSTTATEHQDEALLSPNEDPKLPTDAKGQDSIDNSPESNRNESTVTYVNDWETAGDPKDNQAVEEVNAAKPPCKITTRTNNSNLVETHVPANISCSGISSDKDDVLPSIVRQLGSLQAKMMELEDDLRKAEATSRTNLRYLDSDFRRNKVISIRRADDLQDRVGKLELARNADSRLMQLAQHLKNAVGTLARPVQLYRDAKLTATTKVNENRQWLAMKMMRLGSRIAGEGRPLLDDSTPSANSVSEAQAENIPVYEADRIVPEIIQQLHRNKILPYIKDPYHIYVFDDSVRANKFIDIILSVAGGRGYNNKIRVVGFDTETGHRPTGSPVPGPSTIQIAFAEGLVGVFQVHQMIADSSEAGQTIYRSERFPRSLQELLSSTTVYKVGVGIYNDVSKLHRSYDFRIPHGTVIPLDFLGATVDVVQRSLAGLSEVYCNETLQKSQKGSGYKWDAENIGKAATLYAASDALAGLRIFRAMVQPPSKVISLKTETLTDADMETPAEDEGDVALDLNVNDDPKFDWDAPWTKKSLRAEADLVQDGLLKYLQSYPAGRPRGQTLQWMVENTPRWHDVPDKTSRRLANAVLNTFEEVGYVKTVGKLIHLGPGARWSRSVSSAYVPKLSTTVSKQDKGVGTPPFTQVRESISQEAPGKPSKSSKGENSVAELNTREKGNSEIATTIDSFIDKNAFPILVKMYGQYFESAVSMESLKASLVYEIRLLPSDLKPPPESVDMIVDRIIKHWVNEKQLVSQPHSNSRLLWSMNLRDSDVARLWTGVSELPNYDEIVKGLLSKSRRKVWTRQEMGKWIASFLDDGTSGKLNYKKSFRLKAVLIMRRLRIDGHIQVAEFNKGVVVPDKQDLAYNRSPLPSRKESDRASKPKKEPIAITATSINAAPGTGETIPNEGSTAIAATSLPASTEIGAKQMVLPPVSILSETSASEILERLQRPAIAPANTDPDLGKDPQDRGPPETVESQSSPPSTTGKSAATDHDEESAARGEVDVSAILADGSGKVSKDLAETNITPLGAAQNLAVDLAKDGNGHGSDDDPVRKTEAAAETLSPLGVDKSSQSSSVHGAPLEGTERGKDNLHIEQPAVDVPQEPVSKLAYIRSWDRALASRKS
ncbi:hypothetical protein DFS34DRAFT_147408 [Phlyctochytrium arcticum]|nr:hypothetical protein DFS34DRAFT_147408 [Phlyctochytrium arcticum]